VNPHYDPKPAVASPAPAGIFLATMFSGAGHATQDAGLLIASSTDGVTFRNIRASSAPIYSPAGGVRDPIIMYWHGQWHLVHSYGPNVAPLLFLAQSANLRHWTPLGSLRLAADAANNYVDVPQWMVDPAGAAHLIACVDDHHHWVELHPLGPDPATWGDQANWSAVTTLTDYTGQPLVQGNSFVALRDGTFYMAFNAMEASVYYLRTSASLTAGWSAARPLALDSRVNNGDSENLVVLADGSLRFYISNGNALQKVMWYVDSTDAGLSWTAPQVVTFAGFGPAGINWAQVVRITDADAIAAMVAAGQLPGR
jgi:sucrose-6-phosphate hydrolase SacC (GH32 family)